ncbi:hypothetical protein [Halobacillus ihumii]|uniref:hypothetical protein n=1 Tax=Halobacillus ihumii TaxID=2686092 RepID=UPI0013D08834|nr:hypothetical protein [Halobacillus ihumii]
MEITRFPWAYGELPQDSAFRDLTLYYDPTGESPFPLIGASFFTCQIPCRVKVGNDEIHLYE